MKTEDYNKTCKELNTKIQNNGKIIRTSYERKELSYVNQLEYKTAETVAFSMFPYLLCVAILFGVVAKIGINSFLIKTFLATGFPYIISGISLGFGFIVRKIFDKKNKIKERMKSFSTANTQSEKIQEEVKYTIEMEKTKNRNKAIQQTLNMLRTNQSAINSLSKKYDIYGKKLLQTEEETKKNVGEFSKLLDNKYAELDILTTKKVLNEKFRIVRSKTQRIADFIITGLIGITYTLIYLGFPIILTSISTRKYMQSTRLMYLFVPLIASFIGVGGYMVKRQKDYMKVFNNLNNELGVNALPKKIKNVEEEKKEIDSKIDKKIGEISIIEAELQEQKRIMESIQKDSDEKVLTTSKECTVDKSKQENLLESSYEDSTSFTYENKNKEVEESQNKGNGFTLGLRKNK